MYIVYFINIYKIKTNLLLYLNLRANEIKKDIKKKLGILKLFSLIFDFKTSLDIYEKLMIE
jgi:hypothetical protein